MQGRLSPILDNKIQAFPEKYWQKEFLKIKKTGLNLIEWTLDYEKLNKNPLLSIIGKKKIKYLKKKYSVKINSVTCDCFMQKPFWKIKNNKKILHFLKQIILSSGELGIKYIVIPLVDNGSIENDSQKKNLMIICKKHEKYLKQSNVNIIFESDFKPRALSKFIKKFNNKYFGINYDTGNSASLNYDIDEEFNLYGKYIKNIHIKDRQKFGKTVRLGNGNVNFSKLFKNIKLLKYQGNLILQTARSVNNKHLEEIKINLNYLKKLHNEN